MSNLSEHLPEICAKCRVSSGIQSATLCIRNHWTSCTCSRRATPKIKRTKCYQKEHRFRLTVGVLCVTSTCASWTMLVITESALFASLWAFGWRFTHIHLATDRTKPLGSQRPTLHAAFLQDQWENEWKSECVRASELLSLSLARSIRLSLSLAFWGVEWVWGGVE